MAISKAEREALRSQKKNAFASTMQAKPVVENNAVDKSLEMYVDAVSNLDERIESDKNEPDTDSEKEAQASTEDTADSLKEESMEVIEDIRVEVSEKASVPIEKEGKEETSSESSSKITVKKDEDKHAVDLKDDKAANSTGRKKKEKKSDALSFEERFTGTARTSSILIPEDVDEYMYFRCVEENKTFKQLFREIVLNEIDNGQAEENDYLKKFRKSQKGSIKKCVQLEDDFKEEIKKTAVKYHLKYTSFISYALDKSRLAYKK